MKRSRKDIFESQEESRAIVHLCNDVGLWYDRGFTRDLTNAYGDDARGTFRKLKTHSGSTCLPLGMVQTVHVDDKTCIVNVVAARGVSMFNGVSPMQYDAFERAMRQVVSSHSHVHISYRICDNIKGAEWKRIEALLHAVATHSECCSVTLFD